MKLENYVSGCWVEGVGEGIELTDPVSGEPLVSVSSEGVNLSEALEFARHQGNQKLQQLTYQERAQKLGEIVEVLSANKQEYYDISLKNSGSNLADAAFDVDGALFTLKTFARAGKSLGQNNHLLDGQQVALSRNGEFQGQHFLQPLAGVAVLINAFNFPAWGLWEKAASALLSGVPVLVKPATPTAWLTHKMVADVIESGILPEGSLSIVCGPARDLLDHVQANDVVSFTGSADTAAKIRSHPQVVASSVRLNIEADSVNSLIIAPEVQPEHEEFGLAVREIIKEMTIKAGQKCTAIRRIFVPEAACDELIAALSAQLESVKVGNPRNESVRMGPLVSESQLQAFEQGLQLLKNEARVVFGADDDFQALDVEFEGAAFVQPTLLLCVDGLAAKQAHDVEVFGPLAVVFPYRDNTALVNMLKRGEGSLVASVFSADETFLQKMVPELAQWHGRIMVVNKEVGKAHSGHGNVMPNCLHGGPGRAGGGEELGGLRSLALYHRRYVVQAGPELIQKLSENAADFSLISA